VDVTLIRNEVNLGFPAAVNQGIREAKGDVICLLNNDVIVTPGSINKLAELLDEYAVIGPTTGYVAGAQKVAAPYYNSIPELNKAAEQIWQNYEGIVEDVSFVIGFMMVFKKILYEDVGEFDESMWPCSGEEVDFCFRSIQKGYRIGFAKGIYVHHEGSQTFIDMQSQGLINYGKVCRECDRHLAEKWGDDFWKNQKRPYFLGEVKKINLGCGYNHIEGYINIDNREETKPDMVADILEGLPFDDNSVDEVRAHDFLEHIPIGTAISVITEIWRVLKPGGIFDSLTPSTDGRGAFQDPNHVSFWNRNSWLYYSEPVYRALYGIEANFAITDIDDIITDKRMNIIHTHVIGKAVKHEADES
jgi:glycosyltransferase involved in cell wall biosynthesis